MKVISFYANNLEQLEKQVQNIDFPATLAFVFSDVKHDISEIQRIFNNKNIDIFGATSAGEIFNKQIREHGINVLVTDISKDYYKIGIWELDDDLEFEKAGKTLGKFAKQSFPKHGIVISAPGVTDGDEILNSLFSEIDPYTRVIGGFAGDDLTLTKARNFTNKKIIKKGLLGLILDGEKVQIDGRAVNGWTVQGEIMTITNSYKNIVYEIDGRPAVDVFAENYHLPKEKMVQLMANLGYNYPVLLYRYDRPGILRTPVRADLNDGSVTFAGSMPFLSRIEFGIKPEKSIMDKTIQRFSIFAQKFSDPDFVIMFSCKARHSAFGKDLEYEISGVYDLWQKPMIGFFTYGEIGIGNDNRADFHNETCNVLVVKEV